MYLSFRTQPGEAESRREAGRGAATRVAPVVWALGIVSLLTDASAEMVSSVLPVYLSGWLGLGPAGLGLVEGLQQAMAAVVRLLGGEMADRSRRPRLVAGAGYALSALSRWMLALFGGSTAAVTGAVVTDRIGKGVRTGPRDAMISAATPATARGAAFGVHRALDAVGAFAGPIVAYLVLRKGKGGFGTVFTVSALIGTLGVAAVVLLVPNSAAPVRTTVASSPTERSARRSLWELRPIVVCAAVLGAATIGESLIYLVLQRSAHLAVGSFPLLYVGGSLAFAVLAYPCGRIADRWGRRSMLLGGYCVLGALYVGLALAVPSNSAAIVVVLVAIGLYYAMTDGVLAAMVAERCSADAMARGQSLVQTAVGLGRFVGSVVFGVLWARSGPNAGFAIAALCMAIALGVARVVLPADPARPTGTSRVSAP